MTPSQEATNERIIRLLDQASEQRREFNEYRKMATATENRLKAIIEEQQRVVEAARAARRAYEQGNLNGGAYFDLHAALAALEETK